VEATMSATHQNGKELELFIEVENRILPRRRVSKWR
jgi:hypothetical protein